MATVEELTIKLNRVITQGQHATTQEEALRLAAQAKTIRAEIERQSRTTPTPTPSNIQPTPVAAPRPSPSPTATPTLSTPGPTLLDTMQAAGQGQAAGRGQVEAPLLDLPALLRQAFQPSSRGIPGLLGQLMSPPSAKPSAPSTIPPWALGSQGENPYIPTSVAPGSVSMPMPASPSIFGSDAKQNVLSAIVELQKQYDSASDDMKPYILDKLQGWNNVLNNIEAREEAAAARGAAGAATAESARQFNLQFPLNVANQTANVAKQFELNPLDRTRPLAGHEEGGVLSQMAQRAGIPYTPFNVQDFATAYDIYKNKILGGQQ